MILKGNQRGGAKGLAVHLMKRENDHIEVHELRGFAAQNLMGALNEAYAVSRGTRCKQFLYSLSLNPPPRENVKTADFVAAIDRVKRSLVCPASPAPSCSTRKRAVAMPMPFGAVSTSRP